MKSRLMYIELKTGYSDNGPAWIGKAFFSKTGQTIYFNGSAFKKRQGVSGNYREIATGDEYWISGVKKDGTDRHWAGGGIIFIDKDCVAEYLQFIGMSLLPKNKFEMVEVVDKPAKEMVNEIENEELEAGFDYRLRFKELHNLTDEELLDLLKDYRNTDFTLTHKKARKEGIKRMEDIELELSKRKLVLD